jgi:hypothetical protein
MARCDSAAPTTEQIAPCTSSSLNAMHAIIRFSRYIADLDMRRHHSYCDCEHAPRKRHAHIVTAITPSGYSFAFRLHFWYFSLQTAFILVLVNGL